MWIQQNASAHDQESASTEQTAVEVHPVLILQQRTVTFKNPQDREFLYEALRQCNFDEPFVQLIKRMHTGTTARFSVNGDQSEPIPIESGIRQGCPLAPLLFLIVVELLGLAIHQHPGLSGLSVPGAIGETHIFSAFVDSSFAEQCFTIPTFRSNYLLVTNCTRPSIIYWTHCSLK